MTRDDPDASIAAARDLARRGAPGARELLISALPERKLEVAELLGRIGAAWAVEPLASLLHDPDPDVRSEAILALARTNQTSAVPWIVAALGDPEPERREEARVGLMRLLGGEIADQLSTEGDDPDEADGVRAWWAANEHRFPPQVAIFEGAPLAIDPDVALLATASPSILGQLIDEIQNWVGADLPDGTPAEQAAWLRTWWPANRDRFAIGRRYYYGHPG
jgi:hypothetical protein